jgi:hypothetical protein
VKPKSFAGSESSSCLNLKQARGEFADLADIEAGDAERIGGGGWSGCPGRKVACSFDSNVGSGSSKILNRHRAVGGEAHRREQKRNRNTRYDNWLVPTICPRFELPLESVTAIDL